MILALLGLSLFLLILLAKSIKIAPQKQVKIIELRELLGATAPAAP
jgi:hypothetical protein